MNGLKGNGVMYFDKNESGSLIYSPCILHGFCTL